MSTMERLFVEIFDRKNQIERQLYQQFESFGESLACNVIADGRRPPPWLLDLVPAATICPGPGEFRQPSSALWSTKRKTCSATWEFIQGTLPRFYLQDDSDFESSINDFVIAPTVDKQTKCPHAVEEIHRACSRDEVRPTNLKVFEAETLHSSQGAEKLFSYVDAFEDKASESIVCHDGSEEGQEPSDVLKLLNGCDISGILDASSFKSNSDEAMNKFKGSNIDPPYMVEDNVPSLAKERTSTTPHVIEEFNGVRSMHEVRLTNSMPFESQIDHISSCTETLFSNADTFENKARESLVRCDISVEGKEPYNVTEHCHGGDISGISDTAGVKSSCDETIPDFKVPSSGIPYAVEVYIPNDTDIPSLPKEQASATPHVVDEIFSVCSRDEVRTSDFIPCESEIHHTSHGAEKFFSHGKTFENKLSQNIGHHGGFEEGEEPFDATQCSYSGDGTISDIAGVKPSCDETMLEFEGSSIGLPYTVDVNIFNDADIPSLPKERASATRHLVNEILSVCSRDEVRNSDVIPCESEIYHTSHSAEKLFSHVDIFENKVSHSIGHDGGFEEGEEAYDAAQCSYSCDVTIPDIASVKPSCDETMLEFEGSKLDFPYTREDDIALQNTDIPSLTREGVSTTPHMVAELLSTCSRDEVRVANIVPFESEFHHTARCGVDAFEYKASERLGRHDGSEEGKEPYDAPYRCGITSISDTGCVKSFCDETMPVFEGFSIDLPYEEDSIVCKDSDIPGLAKERAFALEQLRQSRIFLTPRSKPSIMNRINIISDGFNSSPLGILRNMDLGFSFKHNNPDIKHFTTSSSIKLMDIFCNNGSQLDGSAFESSHSLSSSSSRFGSELHNLPLTPPAIKLSHGRLSGKRSSSSVKVSSNPELICFRIDENSSTTEENADVVQVGYSTHRASSRNIEVSTNSKPLSDVTSLYKNDTCLLSNFKEFLVRDSLESVNSDTASSLGFEDAGRKSNFENTENTRYIDVIKDSRRATRAVNKMSERPSVSCRSSDRIRNYQNIRKGCKPSNILSCISSFIPQIQLKKQQALPLQRKKDIKVKALEAAEAAKRLEDQMKKEREERKAAVKLEREKLKQENAKLLRLKQNKKDEERRKKEDGAAARKRQREAEERKIKDRKRRCIEETRMLQREHRDKVRCDKAEKDIQQKPIDEKQRGKQRNNGGQKKLERGGDATESQMAVEMQHCTIQIASTEAILVDDKLQALEVFGEYKSLEKGVGRSNDLRETIGETVSATQITPELQSYEMSPYQSSDEEDMEEDIRHKKFIPLWARGESLGEIIIANQQLDPKDIFNRKQSFNISQVLTTRVLWRRPLK